VDQGTLTAAGSWQLLSLVRLKTHTLCQLVTTFTHRTQPFPLLPCLASADGVIVLELPGARQLLLVHDELEEEEGEATRFVLILFFMSCVNYYVLRQLLLVLDELEGEEEGARRFVIDLLILCRAFLRICAYLHMMWCELCG